MDCKQVRNYLAMYLDSELGPETTFEISQHLESCEACQKLADRETQLETKIKGILTTPHDNDDLIWTRAVTKAVSRSRTGLLGRPVWAIAAVLIGVLGVSYFLLPWAGHRELDLAAAVSSEHVEFLAKSERTYAISGDEVAIESYFKGHLTPQFSVRGLDNSDRKLQGGNLCNVSGAATAHLLFSVHHEPVSVFWFERESLTNFPDVKSRMVSEGQSFHCKVDGKQFYVYVTDDAMVCAVGSVTPAEIQSVVDELVMAQ
ncbi:MAG: zf-HC2 domain-containing protein [Candidatus Zixiibacteriota bacterium]